MHSRMSARAAFPSLVDLLFRLSPQVLSLDKVELLKQVQSALPGSFHPCIGQESLDKEQANARGGGSCIPQGKGDARRLLRSC